MLRKIIYFIVFISLYSPAFGKESHKIIVRNKTSKTIKAKKIEPPLQKATLVVDANSGQILHKENASLPRYPASLTKMMTAYLTFEALESGKLKIIDQIVVSEHSAKMPRSNLGLKKGEKITVRDALLAVIIKSANDAAVALAEKIAGNEEKFAKIMTNRAMQLGMKNTIFKNASGLPHRLQRTTALDMARLAVALKRDYPQYYPMFSRTSFMFKGKLYEGHNAITSNYPGADGLKTGYIRASGHNLVSSARHGEKSIIAVVFGEKTAKDRDRKMAGLLDRYLGKKQVGDSKIEPKVFISEKVSPAPKPRPKAITVVKESKAPSKSTKPVIRTQVKASVS